MSPPSEARIPTISTAILWEGNINTEKIKTTLPFVASPSFTGANHGAEIRCTHTSGAEQTQAACDVVRSH